MSRGREGTPERKQTFKLASPACQAGFISNVYCVEMQATYQPVRERIPGEGVGATYVGETGVWKRNLETCGEAPDPGQIWQIRDAGDWPPHAWTMDLPPRPWTRYCDIDINLDLAGKSPLGTPVFGLWAGLVGLLR